MMDFRNTCRLFGVVAVLMLGAAKVGSPVNAGPNQDPARKPPAPASAEVTLKPIKYQQLIEAVKAQKGNVVVVDVWATYCAPARRSFPIS